MTWAAPIALEVKLMSISDTECGGAKQRTLTAANREDTKGRFLKGGFGECTLVLVFRSGQTPETRKP